jgi:hypothetical protein
MLKLNTPRHELINFLAAFWTEPRARTLQKRSFADTTQIKKKTFIIVDWNIFWVRFQVLMAANMKMAVFWTVALCSLVEVYRRFRGSCCLHHQTHRPDDEGNKHL